MQKLIPHLILIVGLSPIPFSQAATNKDDKAAAELSTVEVKGKVTHLITQSTSASQGIVSQTKIANRPMGVNREFGGNTPLRNF